MPELEDILSDLDTISSSNKVTERLTREAYVDFIGQRAMGVEIVADVLPTQPIDPRSREGNEIVRINNGTEFSGEYLITESTTTYAGGKRERQISGIGVRIDGLKPTPVDYLQNNYTNLQTKPEIPGNEVIDTEPKPEGGGDKGLIEQAYSALVSGKWISTKPKE